MTQVLLGNRLSQSQGQGALKCPGQRLHSALAGRGRSPITSMLGELDAPSAAAAMRSQVRAHCLQGNVWPLLPEHIHAYLGRLSLRKWHCNSCSQGRLRRS